MTDILRILNQSPTNIPQFSPILIADYTALGTNIRKALSSHSSDKPSGVEVQGDKYAAVIVSGRFNLPQASGYLTESFAHSARLVSPPPSVSNLIQKTAKLFVSANAINSPYLDTMLESLNDSITHLENERKNLNTLGYIECGNLVIYPEVKEGHLNRYYIKVINEARPKDLIPTGIIFSSFKSNAA